MNRTITVAPVRKTVRVNAAPAHAFEAFSVGLGRWWPASHSIGRAPLKDVVIEPRAGGRWYEQNEDGSECDWGKVLAWEPPARIVLAWQLNAEWKYDPDLVTEVEVQFIAEGQMTRVEFEHRNLERFGADAAKHAELMRGGWPKYVAEYAQYADAHS